MASIHRPANGRLGTAAAFLLTIVAIFLIEGALAGPSPPGKAPPPCKWSGVCTVNPDFTVQVDPRNLSMPERVAQSVYTRTQICQKIFNSRSCQALEKQSCLWVNIGPFAQLCFPDLSYYESSTSCPGSTAHTVAQCNLKRTSADCARDKRCVWKASYFKEAMTTVVRQTSQRDLCFHNIAKNLTWAQYNAWILKNSDPTNTATFFTWFGRCDVGMNLYKALMYNATCSKTFKRPQGCTVNCGSLASKQKPACLAAGCAWDDNIAALWSPLMPVSPCYAAPARFTDLWFGPKARGAVRDQSVECQGPVAGKSKAACESYRLRGGVTTSGRGLRSLYMGDEEVGAGTEDGSQQLSRLPAGLAGPWGLPLQMMGGL